MIVSGPFDRLLQQQKGKCAICRKKCRLDWDHNHETKARRGLLCPECNKGLGLFYDSPKLLKRAGRYLGQYR